MYAQSSISINLLQQQQHSKLWLKGAISDFGKSPSLIYLLVKQLV